MKNTISVLTFCLGLVVAGPAFSAEEMMECNNGNFATVEQEAAKIKDQPTFVAVMQYVEAASYAMRSNKLDVCAVALAKAASVAGL